MELLKRGPTRAINQLYDRGMQGEVAGFYSAELLGCGFNTDRLDEKQWGRLTPVQHRKTASDLHRSFE